jgi:phage terminase large subunit
MAFVYTTAIKKMLAMTQRKRVIQGGTSSGKTYGIIPILIDKAARVPRLKITVVAESIPAVKDGAVKIFKDIMFETGRWREAHWIGNPMEYTFANGSVIQFKSFDSVGKAKASGKRDILFLNEANHISFEIADALMIRSKETWIDFNPDNEFWAHTEILPEHNSEFLLLTYKDNEGLPPETLEDLKIKIEKAKTSDYWANWCRVYVDGEIGNLQGSVFENWLQCDEIPKEAEFISYGMDFGFTNDPTTLVAVYRYNGELYCDELIYQTKLTNSDLISKLKELNVLQHQMIVADSAEPKSIEDIRRASFRIEGAKKGADSIRNSIDTLQAYKLNITKRSINLIKELRNYKWVTDKDGKSTSQPIDNYNHAIDAVRYVALNRLKKSTFIIQ